MKKYSIYSLLMICLVTSQSGAMLRRAGGAPMRLAPIAPLSTAGLVSGLTYSTTRQASQTQKSQFEGQTPYQILGLKPGATPQQIRTTYLKLSKEFHPDMPHGSTVDFQAINKAYEDLSGPELKSIKQTKSYYPEASDQNEEAKFRAARDEYEKTMENIARNSEKIKNAMDELREQAEWHNKIRGLLKSGMIITTLFTAYLLDIISYEQLINAETYKIHEANKGIFLHEAKKMAEKQVEAQINRMISRTGEIIYPEDEKEIEERLAEAKSDLKNLSRNRQADREVRKILYDSDSESPKRKAEREAVREALNRYLALKDQVNGIFDW